MPSDYISALAKKHNKSSKEIEKLWDKAKQITIDTFGTPEKDWGDREYGYTVGVVKQMLGENKNEKILAMEFLKTNQTPDEFLEQVVSGDFEIGNVIPPGRKKKQRKNFGDEKDINTTPGGGDYPIVVTQEMMEAIDPDFEPFAKIALKGDPEKTFKMTQDIKGVSADVSKKFRQKYDPDEELTPLEAWKAFVADVKKNEKATNAKTNCPECGNGMLVATGYCPTCKKKVAPANPNNEEVNKYGDK